LNVNSALYFESFREKVSLLQKMCCFSNPALRISLAVFVFRLRMRR
jgi:hypothetical protein